MVVTHLKLGNWKNFRKVDVSLEKRTFIIGANASGKSNLLDSLRFLNDIVSVGGGFQEAVQKRRGVSSIRCLAARQFSDIEIAVTLGNDNEHLDAAWEYRLVFSQDKQRRAILKYEQVIKGDAILVNRPDAEDEKDGARLTQTSLEQVNANKYFRELAQFFRSIEYLHVVPQLIREPDRSVGKKRDPFGGDLLERIASTPEKTQKSRLERIRKALEVAVPQLEKLELDRDSRGVPHLKGNYGHWRQRGSWQREDQFSDGTLRLIGLLWSLMDGSGPLLLEEPELSLHSEIVRYLPRMFNRVQRRSNRQIFVSTHSEAILQDSDVGPEEVLLLETDVNGTVVRPASEVREVMSIYDATNDLAEAVLPLTKPRDARQLPLLMQA